MKNLKILKFGGTSVGTGDRLKHVASIIKQLSHAVVVLSAMSGSVKSEGTTSKLLEACQEVLKPSSQKYLDIVDFIENNHVKAASDALDVPISTNKASMASLTDNINGSKACLEPLTPNQVIFEQLLSDIRAECSKLRQFMIAAEVIDELSPRSKDFIISTGNL
jgi:aspartate kinase